MRKPFCFCICENKDADQLRGSREADQRLCFAVAAMLISAFVFATRIVHSLFFLNTKFQAFSYLLWLTSLVCVGPGQTPKTGFLRTRLICEAMVSILFSVIRMS